MPLRPADLAKRKRAGLPFAMLTAWDALSAAVVAEAGAEVVLVGDSLAMVVLGHATTLPVTLDEMLHHCRAVGRGLAAVAPLEQQPLEEQERKRTLSEKSYKKGSIFTRYVLVLLIEWTYTRETLKIFEIKASFVLAFKTFENDHPVR